MRLIDADALLAEVIKNNSCQVGDYAITFDYGAAAAINNAPTIDAEPVVRCRECVHCLWDELHKDKKGRCMEHHLWCEADGFCHKGEKMDGKSKPDEPRKICPVNGLDCIECVPGYGCAKMDGGKDDA